MAKSDKMYSKSPKIEKGEDGKPGISKPTQADAENMGVAGDGIPGSDGAMPVEVHQKISEMNERHMNEIKDMHKRHSKEADKLKEDHMKKKEDK